MAVTDTSAHRTFARWQLARLLRELREERDLTVEYVSRRLGKNRTTLSRTESGEYEIDPERIYALCQIYEVTDSQQQQSLVQMAEATAKSNGLVDSFGAEEWFALYTGAERAADDVCAYEPELIPGPFQTPGYIRAICEAGSPPCSEEQTEKQITLRLERQRALLRPEAPPTLRVVLGAGALTRPIGGSGVMATQVASLLEITQRLEVGRPEGETGIRVLPWLLGAHAALASGPFVILRFPKAMGRPIVYREGHTGAWYLELPDELRAHRDLFAAVWARATPIQRYVDEQRTMDQVEPIGFDG